MVRGASQIATVALNLVFWPVAATHAQAALPPTATTTVTASQLPLVNPPLAQVTHDASIRWDGHLLQVAADGQSLQALLDEIATRTGTRLHGTPPADRIFGSYGPAPLINILSELTDGLNVNVLFVDRTGNKPAELTFTPRNGIATPPTSSQQQEAYQPPPQQPITSTPQTIGPVANGVPGTPGNSGPTSVVPASAASASATIAPEVNANGSNPISPNGVRTPQEIFEQLQRLRAAAAGKQ